MENANKRKIDTKCVYKFIISIIELHQNSKKWLVEWSDKTRTWETYDIVKDLDIFQNFLCKFYTSKPRSREIPSYIA